MVRLRKNKARLKTSRNGLTFKKLQFFLILERFIEKHKTSWYNRKCCIATWINMMCLYKISYKKLWMLLVELLLDKKPFEWVDKSVWAANNRYYVVGHSNAVLNSTYQTVNADDIVPLMLTFIKANRDKLNYLKDEAHDFIRNAAKKFNEENIVVSFS